MYLALILKSDARANSMQADGSEMHDQNLSAFDHAADLIAQADALIVAADAGMGVQSGLPRLQSCRGPLEGLSGPWEGQPAFP